MIFTQGKPEREKDRLILDMDRAIVFSPQFCSEKSILVILVWHADTLFKYYIECL